MKRDAAIAVGLTLGIALVCALPAAAELTVDELISLVPANGTRADILAPGTPPKVVEMTERLKRVAAKDPAWWQNYVKDLPPGSPLPYHPKMEITEDEYLEFIQLAAEPSLIKYGELVMNVETLQEGVYRISAGDTVPEMNGINIDLVRNRITTPFGEAADRSVIARNPEGQKLTGTWEGVQWQHQEMDTTARKGSLINFALGKLDETGKALLYYRVMELRPDEQPTDVMIVLTYAARER